MDLQKVGTCRTGNNTKNDLLVPCSFLKLSRGIWFVPVESTTVGARVVPDYRLALSGSFGKIWFFVMDFSILRPQDALKRISRLQKSILRKIVCFPICRGVSRLLLGFENHKIH